MTQAKNHIIAAAGTIVSMVLVFLLLYYLQITAPRRVEEEGIEIAFGNDDQGGGMPDMAPIQPQPQSEVLPAPAAPSKPSTNDLMVQDETDEDVLALAKQREEEAKRYEEEQVLIRQRQEAEARAEAERQAKEQAAAEKRAKEQAAIDKAQQAMAGFGNTSSAMGANGDNSSTTQSSGVKGNPVAKGFGNIGGNTWTLQGRDCKALPKPSSDFKQEGRVVVNIQVDEMGNVVTASIGSGTNISDASTQQLALNAARQAKFTKGDKTQRGSIIYTFNFK